MVRARPLLCTVALLLGGCIQELHQVAGTGAIYTTRCSADMVPEGGTYTASCTPEACVDGFEPGPVSHVVVALDPGRKVVGYAERVCIQDLSEASARFHPNVPGEGADDDEAASR